jgi:putative NADH-flavin reductase
MLNAEKGSEMRLAVVGAAGRTGRLVVEQALVRGHQVRALARQPEKIGVRHGQLDSVSVDVRDAEALTAAVAGCDALISTIGGPPSRGATDLYSQGVANELRAMAANKIAMLQVVSAAPAGPPEEQPFAARQIISPILWRFFGNQYEDMRRMEAVLRSSSVDWIVLRPPRLVSKPATGNYRVDTKPLARTRAITYPDLAAALLDLLARDDLSRKAVYVAN